jgi:hypothetical protein
MLEKELNEIMARCNATTIAPWVANIEGRDCESGSSFIMTGIAKGENIWQEKRGEDIYLSGATNADLDFIAHARQDIPKLIEEIKRLNLFLEQKNKIGIPIDANEDFENVASQFSIQINTEIKIEIKEYEVLLAIADVTKLNATEIFNFGVKFGEKHKTI